MLIFRKILRAQNSSFASEEEKKREDYGPIFAHSGGTYLKVKCERERERTWEILQSRKRRSEKRKRGKHHASLPVMGGEEERRRGRRILGQKSTTSRKQ